MIATLGEDICVTVEPDVARKKRGNEFCIIFHVLYTWWCPIFGSQFRDYIRLSFISEIIPLFFAWEAHGEMCSEVSNDL